jgi:hypothetical protein
MLNGWRKEAKAMVTKNNGDRQYRWLAGAFGLITVSLLLLVATHTAQLFGDGTRAVGAPVMQQ